MHRKEQAYWGRVGPIPQQADTAGCLPCGPHLRAQFLALGRSQQHQHDVDGLHGCGRFCRGGRAGGRFRQPRGAAATTNCPR